jgi:hypothetical protein
MRLIEKSNELIGNRTRNLLAYSIVHQPTTLPLAPNKYSMAMNLFSGAEHP